MSNIKLTPEAERELLDSQKQAFQRDLAIRDLDSAEHQKRQNRIMESSLEKDVHYRRHVATTTILNIISTAAVVALCVAVIRYID